MILENTRESVLEAKKILGMPADARIGFVRLPDGDYGPWITAPDGREFRPGDEVTP